MANPYFNAAYYLANNDDLVINGVTEETAELHYDLHGAAEGRAPNSWFDAKAYLLASDDLIPNGVTLANAFQHFALYGINEGRVFNNNPALDPANFPASDYATANEDVAEALGITDADDLTAEQEIALMSHYLAHGIKEGREGAGAFGEAAEVAPIAVEPPAVAVGTAGNDTFEWDVDAAQTTASVNGLAGNDTLEITTSDDITLNLSSVENISVTADADVDVDVNGAGVQTLKVEADTGTTVTYTGAKVNSVSLVAGAADLILSGVSGKTDALDVTWGEDAEGLTLSGIEQVKIAVGDKASDVAIAADDVNGDALVFTLTGGKADVAVSADFGSENSADLATVTVNAASFAGDLTVDLSVADLINVDAVVTTGAGDDEITTGTIAGKTATVDAGAGNDRINASEGVDIITGGAGEDTFVFGTGTAVLVADVDGVAAFDTITDFKAADAGVTVDDLATVANGALAGIGDVVDGVVAFQTGFLAGKDLTDVLEALDNALADGNGLAFDFEGNAYVYVSAGAAGAVDLEGDSLIQLTGVSADDLTVAVGSVTFAV